MQYVLEVLFPFIVLLYIIDCIVYIRPQHLVFSSYFGKHFKLKKSGLHMAGLLPVSEIILSHNLPILITSRGIYTVSAQDSVDIARYTEENLHFIAYEDVIKVEAEGKVVKVNGRTLIKFPSPNNARQMKEIFQELVCLEDSSRREKIREFLDETTNLQEIRAIRENCQPLIYIKILSTGLFVNVFGIFPLAIYSALASYINSPVVVYVSVCVYLLILIMAYFARRRLFVTTAGQTLLAMLPAILSPVTSMHIVKELTKQMYTRFDYLAIAAALLPSEAFQSTMREEWLRITYAEAGKQNPELREFWGLRKKALYGLLAKTGSQIEQLLVAPNRRDPSAASYCPICLSEYKPGVEKCADCRVDLKRFNDNVLDCGLE